MVNYGKFPVLGINIDAVDYEYSVEQCVKHAERHQPWIMSALAVHGLMEAALDQEHGKRMNAFDLVVPDGQPVRWAIRLLFGKQLPDRVYGPTFTLKVAEALTEASLSIYLYGSTANVLKKLSSELSRRIPGIRIAGTCPSKFRSLTSNEVNEVVSKIRTSKADAVFVGLGCPRQEVWAYEYRDRLSIPIIAVGAAFDFHSGTKKQAPPILGRYGLEWAYRLLQEPRRLWKRYLLLNPLFIVYLIAQYTGMKRFSMKNHKEDIKIKSFG